MRIVRSLKERFLVKAITLSTATISRFRLFTDCVLIIYMRGHDKKVHVKINDGETLTIRCLLSDSSPQDLENWQITEVFEIHNVVLVVDLVDQMRDFAN